jgi:endonuclease/exonuclease/phosphatase (EEP) superfamily protein YafD
VRLLSWNLFGLSDDHLDVRTEAAMFISLLGGLPEVALRGPPPPPPPEILMFQEVTERTLHAHLRPHLTAAGYILVPSTPRPRGYFEVLAVRAPLRVVATRISSLGGSMGRELVEAVVEGDARWLLLTAHLESLPSGSAQRMVQARTVIERLRAHDGPAVFAGDTNLRADEAERLKPLLDAWEASGSPPSDRWTYVSRSGRRNRYDRIWGRGVRFSGLHCIGRDAVTPDGQPPSDHSGIVVTVEADS